LKQLFHIGDAQQAAAARFLLLRIGEKHASYAFTDSKAQIAYELGYCSTDEWTLEELNKLNAQLVSRIPGKVQIAIDYPEAFIAPANVPATMMTSIYAVSSSDLILHEQVPGWQNINVFIIPKILQQWVNDNFPEAGCLHQLTAMMRWVPSSSADGAIYLDLRENDMQLLCARSGQLLLSNDYDYASPEDVLYYLLKCREQFGLSQETVELKLSGLIDKKSALYKELNQYFIHIEFREASWQLPASELPAHFFTSLNDLALCVS
jgi:hypothetical protein